MTDLTQDYLVVFMSLNGRDGWTAILPAHVPEFLKDPDVMAHLVDGEAAMDCQGDLCWYRAEKVPAERMREIIDVAKTADHETAGT